MSLEVRPYPWQRAPKLALAALAARRELMRRALCALDPGRLPQALTQLIGDDVTISPGALTERRRAPSDAAAGPLAVQFPAAGVRLSLWPEPDLTRACVARLLEQDFELGWADTGIDAALSGAGAALALELARRLARAEAPEFPSSAPVGGDWLLEARATLKLANRPYRLVIRIEACGTPEGRLRALPVNLAALGALRLAVPWVAAVSRADLASVETLEPGDVWLPGPNAWVAGEPPLSAGFLSPPGSEWGLAVRVSGGRTVLGAEAAIVHEDLVREELESSMSQEESELSQIVGETPLVVRLEVGALEMSAAEWAALRPGDVIQSGRRIDDPVVLRAAGREIARGELVDIEGELGVRITQVGPAKVGS